MPTSGQYQGQLRARPTPGLAGSMAQVCSEHRDQRDPGGHVH